MNNSITLNYLTRLTGVIPKSGKTAQPAAGESPFRAMMAQNAEAEGTALADSVSQTGDMTLEEYKQLIWQKISALPMSASTQMATISVQISDEGFQAMKDDPQYERWVLDGLARSFRFQNPWTAMCGGEYVVHHIGATKEEYHGESWYPGYMGGKGAALFEEKSKGSFWEQRIERHKESMELFRKAADERRRMMLAQRMNSGSVNIAALLLDLL